MKSEMINGMDSETKHRLKLRMMNAKYTVDELALEGMDTSSVQILQLALINELVEEIGEVRNAVRDLDATCYRIIPDGQ